VLVVDAVFVVFLVAQATVIFGGHDYLERTTG
jgi:two-component system sensor histidine kinase BaeS